MNKTATHKWPVVRKTRYGKVNIYRQVRDGRDHYTVAWRTGRRRVRETRTDFNEAMDRAGEILAAFEVGESPKPALRGKDKLRQLVGDVPMEALLRCYAEHNNLTMAVPIQQVIDEYLLAKRSAGVIRASQRTLKSHFKLLTDHIGKDIAIKNITVQQINGYLDSISGLRTRYNHRASIRAMFNYARKQKYLPTSLLTVADETEASKPQAKSPDLFTAEDLATFFDAANWMEAPYFVAAACAGIRNEEINRLQWSDVLWEENAFVLRQEITKTSRRRIAYFPPHLTEGLKAIAALAELKGFKKLVPRQVPKVIKNLQTRSGKKWKRNAMRKTYISCAMAVTRNAAELAEQCGNSVGMIQQIYKGLVTKSVGEEWFKVVDTRKLLDKLPEHIL